MEMKVDAEAIEKSINAIPGVCEDGKKAIKKIFEDGFGVEFKKKLASPKEGEVWMTCGVDGMNIPTLIICNVNGDKLRGACLEGNGYVSEHTIGNDGYYHDCKFIAFSPEEYFRKKFDGKL